MNQPEYVQSAASREGSRAAESIVARQLQAYQSLLQRAESLTRFTVAELGGISAITGFALTQDLLSTIPSVLILTSVLAGTVAAFGSIRVAVGNLKGRTISLGPAIDQIQGFIKDEDITESEVALSLIESYREAASQNERLIDKAQRHLVITSHLLFASVTTFLMAMIYVVLGAI